VRGGGVVEDDRPLLEGERLEHVRDLGEGLAAVEAAHLRVGGCDADDACDGDSMPTVEHAPRYRTCVRLLGFLWVISSRVECFFLV
jgi:hypothetical protein